ncbi:MAG: hypothetical protein R2827_05500 [Bdellovibrionales bacterium]
MGLALIQFLITTLVIVVAGTFLTKFADRIAEITGWGRVFLGSLLLAGATSMPELMTALENKFNRYDAVIFLETAAVGDISIEGGNPIRIASNKKAIELMGRG